jgi:ATP/maltotriose-dependent transcriptional regulator MalT
MEANEDIPIASHVCSLSRKKRKFENAMVGGNISDLAKLLRRYLQAHLLKTLSPSEISCLSITSYLDNICVKITLI